ncbi:WxL domain-containing protein [Paenibacillus sp. GCM10027627]
MKAALALSLLLAVIVPAAAATSSNLVDNGGFESYTSGNTGDGWDFSTDNVPAQYVAELSSASVAEGNYSQRLTQDGLTYAGQMLKVSNSKSTGITAGLPLEMKFKSNITSMVGAKLRAKIEYYDSTGRYFGRALLEVKDPTTGFQEFSLSTVLPAGTDHVATSFEGTINIEGGYYNLFIDDVRLYINSVSGEQTQVGIVGGQLEFSTISGLFLDVNLDNEAVMTTTNTSTVRITDNRGNGEGWAVKISATDFLSASLPDPSSGGTASFVLKIPVSNLRLASATVQHVSGQPIHATYGPVASSFTISNASQTAVRAQTGFGMGAYNVPINYSLTIPKSLEIVSQSGTGSKLTTGEYVGTRSGHYTATLNFTIGTGL